MKLWLVLAYLLPVLLAVLLLLRGPLPNIGRLLVLIALPAFYIGHHLGLAALEGWPANTPPPDRFTLLGERILPPDRARGIEGAIELWILPEGETRSRLHRLPYSRELHERLIEARKRRAEGKRQQGVREAGARPGDGAPETGAEWRFEDAPRRSPPPKTGGTSRR